MCKYVFMQIAPSPFQMRESIFTLFSYIFMVIELFCNAIACLLPFIFHLLLI